MPSAAAPSFAAWEATVSNSQSTEGKKGSRADTGPDFVDLAEERHGVTEYPLRNPEEDERWAVNTVRLWMAILTGLITFITVMLILGWMYD